MQRCQICVLENVQEINKEIVKGANLSQLAQENGVSTDSMYRHSREHLSRQLRTGAEVALKNSGLDVMSELDSLMTETRQILEEARAKEHNGLALKAIQQLRGNLSLTAQIQAEIYKQRQAGLIDESELEQFRAWQAERANIGDQLKELSPEDLSIVRDVCIKKISRMNSMEEVEDFRSKSYYMQSYGPQDTETISPVPDATEQEIVGTTPLVRSDTASNGPDQDSNTDESEPSMRRTR
jgi:hypothetical protein